jgi:hypothetical protein
LQTSIKLCSAYVYKMRRLSIPPYTKGETLLKLKKFFCQFLLLVGKGFATTSCQLSEAY